MAKRYKNNCPEGLRKAVREYHEWHGDKRSFAIRILENRSKDRMVLARFVDEDGDKMSSLMFFTGWADGHYDVSEDEAVIREDEDEFVENFKDSDWGPSSADDDDEDDLDQYDLSGTPEDEFDHEEEVEIRKNTFDGGYDDYEENMIL